MYLYASEHALMDYHLNEEKRNKEKAASELPELPVEEKNETGITETK